MRIGTWRMVVTGLPLFGVAVVLAGCGDRDETVVVVERRRPEPVVVERRYERPAPVYVAPKPRRVVVERERPVVVARPAERVVIVREAPPAVRVERRPRPPGRDFVWISGHWRHDGRQYVWAGGRYERSRPQAVYVQPRWVRVEGGWRFDGGHWRDAR